LDPPSPDRPNYGVSRVVSAGELLDWSSAATGRAGFCDVAVRACVLERALDDELVDETGLSSPQTVA
jgi:hypothetical protein